MVTKHARLWADGASGLRQSVLWGIHLGPSEGTPERPKVGLYVRFQRDGIQQRRAGRGDARASLGVVAGESRETELHELFGDRER